MTRVIISEDCGNSPKNIFLEKLTIAFARGNSKVILDSVTEDIYSNIVGARRVEGKAALAEALHKMKNDKAVELTYLRVSS